MSLESRQHQHVHDVKFNTDKRYDLLLRSSNVGFRLADGAARALILNLRTNYLLLPEEETIGEDFVEVHCKPGPSAHTIFTPRGFPTELTAFHDALVYFGEPRELDYDGGVRCAFYIEFRGCLFNELMGDFKRQFKQILNTKTLLNHRAHVPQPETTEAPADSD
ncbi:MAG: hypothetical protein RBU37_26630 [Myxococcota bacterium]|jgi:hypothetical protein|nr:hypothetical protein [Myxococcota bacterium]